MTQTVVQNEQLRRYVETHHIDMIPAGARHGKPWHQFAFWWGGNVNVFNVVLGLGQSAGKMLAEHPDINKLVLTGGTEAGRIAVLLIRRDVVADPRAIAELQPELEVHEQIEDEAVYEPLAHDAGKTDSKLAEWQEKHQDEVDKVEGLIEAMAALEPEHAPWLTKLKAVHASLESHIREEEQEIFPRITKVWDDKKLKQVGANLKEMKAQKLKPAAVR